MYGNSYLKKLLMPTFLAYLFLFFIRIYHMVCQWWKIRGIPAIVHSGCLDSKKIFPLLTCPQGSQGCQKITFYFLKMKMFSFWAKIALKIHKLQKPSKLKKKCQKNPCFLKYFWIFFNFGAILVHQTSTGIFSGSWRIVWHPWDLWGRVNSGDTRVLRFVLIILWQWRRLADFSLLWKCCLMQEIYA